MASPAPADATNGISTPPATANPTTGNPSPPSQNSDALAAPATNGTGNTPADASTPPAAMVAPAEAATSLKDDGLAAKRPRDARLIHLLLSAQGVQAYQERVPLMIMDFAYRYTSQILSDAMALTADGYGLNSTSSGRGQAQEGNVSTVALRLSMGSRQNYQFQPSLPKEVLLEMAQERNRITLPKPERDYGYRLPPERYILTGTSWGIKEEWDSEEEVEEEGGDAHMQDALEGPGMERGEMDEDEQAEFEEAMGLGNQDTTMADV